MLLRLEYENTIEDFLTPLGNSLPRCKNDATSLSQSLDPEKFGNFV